MKKIITLFYTLLSLCVVAQTDSPTIDSYQIEKDGFLSNPIQTPYGLVFTNNHCDHIYLYNEVGLQVIANTKGCGRYFSVSPKGYIGYKKIMEDGKQIPVLKNLEDFSETTLPVTSDFCGQISFANNGSFVYSSAEEILFVNGNNSQSFNTETYVNMPVISPDGSKIVYNNSEDQLMILSIHSSESVQLTDGKKGYAFAKWSPNSQQLLFQSFNGELFVWNENTNSILAIGKAASPVWFDNNTIIFQQNRIENQQLLSADLYLYNLTTQISKALTSTTNVFEMNPSVSGNSILYHTYNGNEIFKIEIENYDLKGKPTLLYSSSYVKKVNGSNKNGTNVLPSVSSTIYIPNVPYVHQMYDTPDWHSGSGSCGPTAAMMLLAYYNKLPKWENTVCCPYSHTSEYGYYIAAKYRYNGNTFDLTASDAKGNTAWGGYGYIWGQASPRTIMDNYLNLHSLSADTAVEGDNYQATLQELYKGFPQPICNFLTSSGHIVVATGALHPQRTIICNDPYGNKNGQNWPDYNGTDSYYDWPGYNNGYENFDGGYGYGGIAWTMDVHGQEKTYNDTIIDDLDFNHGFYVGNQYPSNMIYFRDDTVGGYDNHFWWTYSMASSPAICTVSWTPTIPTDGKYKVSAFIPAIDNEATEAIYTITHALGTKTVLIDQNANQGQWVDLGDYYFYAGQYGNVVLGDSTGMDNEKIVFDAMKWEKKQAVITDLLEYTSNDFSFSIFPNPVKDKLNLTINGILGNNTLPVSIYNSLGQEVYTNKLMSSSNSLVISLDQKLADGMYTILIANNNKVYTESFLLRREE